jgi:molybdate transport system substrate-binding protein
MWPCRIPSSKVSPRQTEASLKKAGGDALATTVYKTKVAGGSTVLTQIHHWQTPLF